MYCLKNLILSNKYRFLFSKTTNCTCPVASCNLFTVVHSKLLMLIQQLAMYYLHQVAADFKATKSTFLWPTATLCCQVMTKITSFNQQPTGPINTRNFHESTCGFMVLRRKHTDTSSLPFRIICFLQKSWQACDRVLRHETVVGLQIDSDKDQKFRQCLKEQT